MPVARWGDEEEGDVLPSRVETGPDARGIRTVTEWKRDDKGNKIKVVTKIKTVERITKISKRALERREWSRFGNAVNSNENITYPSFEEIKLEDPDVGEKPKAETDDSPFDKVGSSIVVCRTCGMTGDHWTLKCPYKNTPPDQIPDLKDMPPPEEEDAPAASSTGKYVPPSLRRGAGAAGAAGGSDMMRDDRDNATLRVTNISTDTRESDLQELFRPFGPIARIYLAKDRETMQSRGFAFVSFHYRQDAEKALQELEGFGYDHLILKLEWAKPSARNPGEEGSTFRSGYGKALPQGLAPKRE